MNERCILVFDVGKTNAKLTLWTRQGQPLARRVRRNHDAAVPGYRSLDAAGIEEWLAETLTEFARQASIGTIIPVGHGAAAALIHEDRLFSAPMDYEHDIDASVRASYLSERDPFSETGSPALPQGLNLGTQLYNLERTAGSWPTDLRIVPWPQYWAWRLTDVMASEVSSLGCHTDLWNPHKQEFSGIAQRRGWAERFAPLKHAGAPLGVITPEWSKRTGIPSDCVVHCGLHDSNAALLAARAHADGQDQDTTVLSTGTWFVAMRVPAANTRPNLAALDETRDCLINVDVEGRPVPSSRFMGGREAEVMAQLNIHALTTNYDPQRLLDRIPDLLKSGTFALPSFTNGCGPFPRAAGGWRKKPGDPADQRAIAGLHLALLANASLDLIGSRDRLIIEGRFAEAVVFIRALAALRPQQQVFVSNAHDDVPFGAMRLIEPTLKPASALVPVEPLAVDFSDYAHAWLAHAQRSAA